jgi:hypothetical protein
MTLAISKGQTDILLSLCIKLASSEVITKVMYAVGVLQRDITGVSRSRDDPVLDLVVERE